MLKAILKPKSVTSESKEKPVRFKKSAVSLTALALILCCSLSGCGSDKSYGEVNEALSSVTKLKSGRITVLSQIEPSAAKVAQSIKSDLLFMEKGEGYQYCHTQYDKSDKPTFCEYSDGEKTQQWLIGKGWGGSETAFTKENPHKYIALLSNTPAQAAVETIICEEQPTGKQYTITLKPDVMNDTVYKNSEMTVISEEISLLVDENGMLQSYIDKAEIEDSASKQSRKYKLQITISDSNSITEVPQPQLREYTAAATGAEAEVAEK